MQAVAAPTTRRAIFAAVPAAVVAGGLARGYTPLEARLDALLAEGMALNDRDASDAEHEAFEERWDGPFQEAVMLPAGDMASLRVKAKAMLFLFGCCAADMQNDDDGADRLRNQIVAGLLGLRT